MKTMIIAAAAVLSLSAGVGYAGEGDGAVANTQFTQIPGVFAQAQGQAPAVATARRTARRSTSTSRTPTAAHGCSVPTATRAPTANSQRSGTPAGAENAVICA